MHFCNPANAMKLVEVVASPASDADTIERIEALANGWGKVAVRVADVPEFIVNRVAYPFYAESFRAMQEGVAPSPY
jgi:3-hydroxybutyryl-CoA dehydrogenase